MTIRTLSKLRSFKWDGSFSLLWNQQYRHGYHLQPAEHRCHEIKHTQEFLVPFLSSHSQFVTLVLKPHSSQLLYLSSLNLQFCANMSDIKQFVGKSQLSYAPLSILVDAEVWLQWLLYARQEDVFNDNCLYLSWSMQALNYSVVYVFLCVGKISLMTVR